MDSCRDNPLHEDGHTNTQYALTCLLPRRRLGEQKVGFWTAVIRRRFFAHIQASIYAQCSGIAGLPTQETGTLAVHLVCCTAGRLVITSLTAGTRLTRRTSPVGGLVSEP